MVKELRESVDFLEVRKAVADTLTKVLILQGIIEHYSMNGALPAIRAASTGLREIGLMFSADLKARRDTRHYITK